MPGDVVYVLTLLSAVVVVLTRFRLSRGEAAAQHRVGMSWLNRHTWFGVAALLLWVSFSSPAATARWSPWWRCSSTG